MKMRNKGKVHPSPSSQSSSSCNGSNRVDASSVLKLLPAAILALVSVLSMDDREVFAYMVTKSLKSATNSFPVDAEKKKSTKKSNGSSSGHKPPVFDCDCFDCYTSFWYRWDSSPNRELIHQAIEAFEEHFEAEQSSPSSKKTGRGKRREKFARRGAYKSPEAAPMPDLAEIEESSVVVEPENVGAVEALVEERTCEVEKEIVQTAVTEEEDGVEEQKEEAETAVVEAAVMRSPPAGNSSHKGFARKMLPDVMGLLNSRLWSLWSPNA